MSVTGEFQRAPSMSSTSSWGEVLGDNTVAAAMLDRLLHRSVVLNLDGDSYRLRYHNARSDKLVRGKSVSIIGEFR